MTASLALSPALAETIGTSAVELLRVRDAAKREKVELDDVVGVWWRRPRNVLIDSEVIAPEFQEFCFRATNSLIKSFMLSCPVYNSLEAEMAAIHKPYQLYLADQVGLHIPKTLITSNPHSVLKFYEEINRKGKQVVYKHAVDPKGIGLSTRILTFGDIERLDSLRFAPAIFQERISGGIDLRIVVIGKRIFASEWRTEIFDPQIVDIRDRDGVRMWPTKCPSSLQEKLLAFHKMSGLVFGVYDFKLDNTGIPYFLEVNPSGQWLDMELESNHPISEAWARVLVNGIGAEGETLLEPWNFNELNIIFDSASSYKNPKKWNKII